MRKKLSRHLAVIIIISMASLFMNSGVQAGSKSTEATKRTAYQDDSTESMYEVNRRLEAETKEYKQKILLNGEESIRLLREIRDLLQELNEKE